MFTHREATSLVRNLGLDIHSLGILIIFQIPAVRGNSARAAGGDPGRGKAGPRPQKLTARVVLGFHFV